MMTLVQKILFKMRIKMTYYTSAYDESGLRNTIVFWMNPHFQQYDELIPSDIINIVRSICTGKMVKVSCINALDAV
jgi:hypothetical protein